MIAINMKAAKMKNGNFLVDLFSTLSQVTEKSLELLIQLLFQLSIFQTF